MLSRVSEEARTLPPRPSASVVRAPPPRPTRHPPHPQHLPTPGICGNPATSRRSGNSCPHCTYGSSRASDSSLASTTSRLFGGSQRPAWPWPWPAAQSEAARALAGLVEGYLAVGAVQLRALTGATTVPAVPASLATAAGHWTLTAAALAGAVALALACIGRCRTGARPRPG